MTYQELPKVDNKRVLRLVAPVFTQDRIIGFKAGLRPFRKGGVRIEEETIGNKIVFHNYGHGAGGVSVGYGYSTLTFNKFATKYHEAHDAKKVAVIGGGYIGLFTSLLLRTNGYDVTIYADKTINQSGFTKPDSLDKEVPTTSQIAGGFWVPYGYDFNFSAETRERHELAARLSYAFYEKMIHHKTMRGVSYKKTIHVDSIDYVKRCVPNGLIKDYEDLKVTWNGVDLIDAHYFTTLLIDGDLFLNDLKQECVKLGVKFVDRHFPTVNDIQHLEEKYIFNCTGCSAGKLFNDPNVYPVKGQLVAFKPTPGVDYFFRTQIESGAYVSFYP